MFTVGDLGLPGLLVSWVVTPIVVFIGYKVFAMGILHMEDQKTMAIVLTCATSICGASAATAVFGCVGGRTEILTVAIAVVNLMTIPQMLGLPYLAQALGQGAKVSGAWFGGSIDATGAVVASGGIYDDLEDLDCDVTDCALDVASTIKIMQNVIIGPVCLVVMALWASSAQGSSPSSPSKCLQLWQKFPKFILGFLSVSVIITIVNSTADEEAADMLRLLVSSSSRWWFALGFAGIGLTTNFKELAEPLRGGRVIILYAMVQLFDLVLTFGAAVLSFKVLTN